MDRIDWHLWRSLAAVCRCGSLSEAARELGSTQPTLSRQIAQLEAAVGHPLFSRSKSGLTPTDLARALAPVATMMTDQARTLESLARSDRMRMTTTLTVTASHITGAVVLPPILGTFMAAWPTVRVRLSLTDAVADVIGREADLAVRHVAPRQGDLWGRKVGTVRIRLFAHREYVRRHGAPRDLPDLAGHRIVAAADHIARIPELASLALRPDLECDDDLGLLAALRAGIGIGYCQEPIGRDDPQLVPVLPDYCPASLPLWVVTHADLRKAPAVRALLDHLAEGLARYCA
ncbi:LysR family transcriptional regulator [Gluconacetobacter tumulisoli]|uniref:LysR family transcriptional regulator n=1 Tax=Gluconacetobacter tumulisoli TaxID=1286189 RepID=A0A7W4PKC1_9PROT|nr:LysR family transcriptional regulator [Gluconacetobacter tumulisoli]MBB2200678.1 LysR family transcriptional regulator [Gluconacetobacter tumulisoli]